ncbi:sugar ABC transporter substrate-binding protein [Paractinoplanes abujensis]|uniref:Sorbitol/mannitol transport system substrate-binding protein n=1 Tax=Paractinoplanes abujensis TaxID=882441 RepID=A0A7W7CUR6_9ACTN|nr:sugar ABC transporter substrate-binding protein [Actinoplanes abujensis]MBB4693366.1 sorbitol/mannitol transport system substrate-binding protein [Actinoplanes abujensis]GID24570.1 sugar ABC transporter substrate-binding protein [Actinoplanes abujensis]
MSRRRYVATALVAVASLAAASACSDPTAEPGASGGNTTITVALAANPQMKTAETLIADFEQKNPGIKVKFTTLPENDLRPAVTKDVATKAGQYDVAMIGSYEVPIWAKNKWIAPLDDYVAKDTAWDSADVLQPIKDIVSADGKLYGAPFYGSSSFLFYRKDLAAKAGVTIPEKPTWDQVAAAAAKMDDKAGGVSGICLRGLPGWGQNLASLTTVINTFGGRWFDEQWNPQLTSPETTAAVKFYVDLLRAHGQPDAAKDGWEGCLQQITQGKTAMWYDDTVFAGSALDQATPQVKENLGFALAPVNKTDASGWLWSWGLAITESSKNKDAAWKFISWATSKDYIKLAGEKAGWDAIPPGSRTSTYALPEYQKAASSYADLTIKSIDAANPNKPTVQPVPYTGVQYVQIAEFTDIGDYVSQQVAGAISGTQTVEQALQKSQTYTEGVVKKAGYLK